MYFNFEGIRISLTIIRRISKTDPTIIMSFNTKRSWRDNY